MVEVVVNNPKPIVATVSDGQPNFTIATVMRTSAAQRLDELLDVSVESPAVGSILIWDDIAQRWIASNILQLAETIIDGGSY